MSGKDMLINQWNMKIEDPKATFAELLQKNNAQANITFTEFCDYVICWRLNEFEDLASHEEI